MEKTIVQFIIENIIIFVPLGAVGILATIILFFLPKKETSTYEDELSNMISIFKFRLNIYMIVYLFVWLMMVIIGVLSTFYIPTLIGGIIAAVPLVVLMILEFKTKKSKVS